MKEINNEPEIKITTIKKLNVLDNDTKNYSNDYFNKFRINGINNFQNNFFFFKKKKQI